MMTMMLARRFSTSSFTNLAKLAGGVGKASVNVYRDPIRQVFISQSNDVFTNLALEDWLYQNHDFDHKSLLLLWRNDPCVVIGRHQNPWVEANVPFLKDSFTSLARRNSGGGTVYHDLGNLNCTFFTRRSAYDRRRNLEIVCQAISDVIGASNNSCTVSINSRDDIVATGGKGGDERKISGTAAKLGRESAYHHCTVLVDVNECALHDALNSKAEGVESRATQSVRVPVKNLMSLCPNVTVGALQESLGWRFLKTDVDGEVVNSDEMYRQRGFQMVRPEEVWFPGLDRLRDEFESKQWIFGKTPKFKVKRTFPVPNELVQADGSAKNTVMDMELEVVSGKVETVRIGTSGEVAFRTMGIANSIQGLEFGPLLPEQVFQRIDMPSEELKQFVTSCVLKTVSSFA